MLLVWQNEFSAFGTNRIPDNIKTSWEDNQELDFVWEGSHSGIESDKLFTHVMDSYGYCPPNIPRNAFGGMIIISGKAQSLKSTNPMLLNLHITSQLVQKTKQMAQGAGYFAVALWLRFRASQCNSKHETNGLYYRLYQ